MSGETDPVFWVGCYVVLVMLTTAGLIAWWDELTGDDR